MADDAQVAERRLIAALGRMHRAAPLAEAVRVDALLARVREAPGRAASHRGGARLDLTDAGWLAIIDGLATAGRLVRDGRWVRLPDHRPGLGPAMRARADALLDALRSVGLRGARADAIARRVGLPPQLLDGLVAAGELVRLGSGVDLAAESYRRAVAAIARLPANERRVGSVARSLGTSRRVAEALLAASGPPPPDTGIGDARS